MAKHDFDADEIIIDEAMAIALRDMFEGMWVSVPVQVEGDDDPDDEDFDDEDDEEGEMEIFIVQSDDLPHRFLAQYRRDDVEGEIDIRALPTALQGDGEGMSLLFTFVEEDEVEALTGGGFAMGPQDEVLVGMMLYHMGPDIPLCWQRVTKELPDEVRELILEGEWLDGDDDEEEDEDGPVLLDDLQGILGELLSFSEEAEDDDDEVRSHNPPREVLLEKTLEEFLLFQSSLAKQLEKGGISTVAALLSATDDELLAIKGVGPGRLSEIRRIIQAWGLTSSLQESYEVDDDLLNVSYRFKVSLDWIRGVWREVELLGSHTMHDLHNVIQQAFDWDDDHLYAFYMSGRYWDGGSAIEHPHSEGDVAADDIQLAGLGLEARQRFVYLFDFGDELRHSIEVVSIGDKALPAKQRNALPRIVKSHGESPAQYEWDDEDEDDWEES